MKKNIILLSLSFFLFSGLVFPQDTLKSITLEDIWTYYKFYPKSVQGINSLDNGEQYTMIKDGSIVVYDYKTGDSVDAMLTPEKLMLEGKEKPLGLQSFKMSTDETKFLIPSETEQIYRHSSKSFFYVYDNQTGSLTPLSTVPTDRPCVNRCNCNNTYYYYFLWQAMRESLLL